MVLPRGELKVIRPSSAIWRRVRFENDKNLDYEEIVADDKSGAAAGALARACGGLPDGAAPANNSIQFPQGESGRHAHAAAAGERIALCRARQRHDRSGVRLSVRRLESRAEERP